MFLPVFSNEVIMSLKEKPHAPWWHLHPPRGSEPEYGSMDQISTVLRRFRNCEKLLNGKREPLHRKPRYRQ